MNSKQLLGSTILDQPFIYDVFEFLGNIINGIILTLILFINWHEKFSSIFSFYKDINIPNTTAYTVLFILILFIIILFFFLVGYIMSTLVERFISVIVSFVFFVYNIPQIKEKNKFESFFRFFLYEKILNPVNEKFSNEFIEQFYTLAKKHFNISTKDVDLVNLSIYLAFKNGLTKNYLGDFFISLLTGLIFNSLLVVYISIINRSYLLLIFFIILSGHFFLNLKKEYQKSNIKAVYLTYLFLREKDLSNP